MKRPIPYVFVSMMSLSQSLSEAWQSPRLHRNRSKWNRAKIGTDRTRIYTGTDRTVPYRTASRLNGST